MRDDSDTHPILREGSSCWRIRNARRAAFLIDAQAYFGALADALEQAEEQVILLGWDFHSGVELRRPGGRSPLPTELGPLLEALVQRRPALRIYVLNWDFSWIYLLEREGLSRFRFESGGGPRLRYETDGHHPVGASHHQKLVVIDDALAFAGGIDLTQRRWDSRRHRPDDPRRHAPEGAAYRPFHDVQMAVDGEAAAALGELARGRWRRATGETLTPPRNEATVWPRGLAPSLESVEVGIARTMPAFDGEDEVREVEQLFLRSIASARRSIYIEQQYLTSARIGAALAARLEEQDGPEVIVVMPQQCSGWLEETTMGVLRARLVRRLRRADRSDRLRLYYPAVPGLGGDHVNVHAKVMVVDDRLAHVGSANLSNRSMGLDSECDLAVEAAGEGPPAAAIAGFRNDLLAEHLGTDPQRVARAVEATGGSLAAAIESLRGDGRSLRPLDTEVPEWIDASVPSAAVIDPERPALDRSSATAEAERGSGARGPARVSLLAGAAVAILLAALWRLTPVAEWIEPERLAVAAHWMRRTPLGAVAAVTAIALASVSMVPVTATIVASGLVFGWAKGAAVALAGALLGALAGYVLGGWLWRDAARRLGGEGFERVSRALGRRGMLSMAILRLLPVAPFTIVNLAAGVSHVRLRDYLAGTAIGMAPGTVLLCVFADRAWRAVAEPGVGTALTLLGVGVAGLVLWRLLRRVVSSAGLLDASASDSGGGH